MIYVWARTPRTGILRQVHLVLAVLLTLLSVYVSANLMTVLFQTDPWNVHLPRAVYVALFLGIASCICVYIFYLIRNKVYTASDLFRYIYIIVFSLFFYYKGGGNYYVLLLICAVVTHFLSKKMYEAQDTKKRKMWLAFIVIANLGMLSYYKYTGFLTENINAIFNGDLSFGTIFLPIGVSFFVFEAVSYAVDLYRKEMEPARTTLDFCFYISFFPKLVMGPIIRAKDFLPQMYQKLQLTKREAGYAIFLILIGLIKKAVISDYISSNFVNRVFDPTYTLSAFENLMGVYGYALQIYCDFSGYSDIAIGLSLLMGFTIPANFNTPYKSQSITEFWRRWHISLSSWLRDYLYISLGGNRKGNFRTYVNLFLTMLLGGLWHGASWTFVVWGGLHGIMLAVERYIKKWIPLSSEKRFPRLIRVVVTFHLVAFCWIFFRAKDFETAGQVISNIGDLTFNLQEWWAIIQIYRNVFLLMLIGFIMVFLPQKFVDNLREGFINLPLVAKAAIMGFVFWIVYATALAAPQPFIYTQF
nr:MBOAT family O-acyltransferase [Dysgonomonas sp. 25]